jgi:integrase
VASIETLVLKDGKKRYRVWWRDPSGRVRAKRFPRYDAARSFLRDVEVDKVRGSYVDPAKGKITVADAWGRFEAGPLRSYKESTQASHRFHFRRYVLPALGDCRLNSVEKEDVERLMHDMDEKARASGRKLKAGGYGSREKTLRALQRFFSEMVTNGRIARNPALGVKPGSRPAVALDGGGQALEVEQVTSLVDATPDYWKPLIALLATSGLRISEALGLRRRDLDLAGGTATVRQTVVEVEGRQVLSTPKSRASRRAVKLIPSVVSMLKKQALPLDPDGFVFTQPGKTVPLSRSWFNRRVLKPAGARAGIRPLASAHDLRHTAGAIASKTGMHPMAVKEMMGHSSIKVTYDVYGHLFPTMHEAGVAAVEAAFGAGSGFDRGAEVLIGPTVRVAERGERSTEPYPGLGHS